MPSYPQLPKTERHRSFWVGGAGGHGTEPAVQTWGLPPSPKHLYICLAGWARSCWGRTHSHCVYLIGWRAGTQDSCWGRAEILWGPNSQAEPGTWKQRKGAQQREWKVGRAGGSGDRARLVPGALGVRGTEKEGVTRALDEPGRWVPQPIPLRHRWLCRHCSDSRLRSSIPDLPRRKEGSSPTSQER